LSPGDGGLVGYFSIIRDPRIERTKKHLLVDILTIAICAVICGAEGWEDLEEFGLKNEEWFKTFLEIPHGIPSHDTFARVFSILDSQQLEECFFEWTKTLQETTAGRLIAIDGKMLRSSFNKATGKKAIHLVSAWVVENQVILGQVKVDDKSNEITAVPRLLDFINVKGSVISMDAMGCQTAHAKKIVEKGGDYLFSLKGNQGTLNDEVRLFLNDAKKNEFKDTPFDYLETTEKGHGRIEIRKYYQTGVIEWFQDREQWRGLQTIGMVESTRIIGDQTTNETRYFISSLHCNAQEFAKAVRGHWGTENGQHWCLDVGMGEDSSRIRVGNASENYGVLRRIALNLLKKDKSTKRGIRAKSRSAGWSREYLIKVLLNPSPAS
jgi:predicted transposase YbfD/YdcC